MAPPTLDTTLLSAKSAMRRRMRARRLRLAAGRDEVSARLAELAPVELWAAIRWVAAYLPTETEIDPAPLVARLTALGARDLLPAVTEHGRPLAFRDRGRPEDLVPDAAGLPAPPASSSERTPDLILTPLLAFDRRGGRLGQGGGFYDRTIAALRASGRPVTVVGLAYAGQEVERVPTDDCDALLDGILTETAYIPVRKDPSCA